MKSLLSWCMTTRIYLWIVRDILSWVRISCSHTRLTGKKYLEGYKLLKPGYIILSTDESRISSFLTPGDLDHAALCICDDYEVGEMTHLGYTKSTFFDICHTSDRVVLLECLDWDEEYTKKVVEKCKSLVGTQYDFQFSPGDITLYCSELIPTCDIENRLKWHYRLDGFILPQDIYNLENIHVVWDSNK